MATDQKTPPNAQQKFFAKINAKQSMEASTEQLKKKKKKKDTSSKSKAEKAAALKRRMSKR